MTTPLKIGLTVLGLIIALSIADYLFEFVNAWAGIGASILTLLGCLQLWGLIDARKIMFVLLTIALTTSCTRVEPNYEGVLMINCGKKGIDDFVLVSGKVGTAGVCKTLYEIPMFQQAGDVDPIDLTLDDGTTGFIIDPEYFYKPVRGKGREIAFNYKQFSSGAGFLDDVEDNILSRYVREEYRDVARTYSPDSLLNNMNQYEESVKANLKSTFEKAYFELIDVTSSLTPPESLVRSIADRNREISEAKRELESVARQTQTLTARKGQAQLQLEINVIEAKASLELSKGLTPEILELKKIEAWSKAGCPVPQVIDGESFYNVVKKKN